MAEGDNRSTNLLVSREGTKQGLRAWVGLAWRRLRPRSLHAWWARPSLPVPSRRRRRLPLGRLG